jgi:hypothetical protein
MIEVIPREISLILDSNTNTGAINKSSDGASFSIQFGEPLLIPSNAINPTLDVEESAIWYSTPNVYDSGTNQNNNFRIIRISDAQVFNLTIPAGLYSVISMQNAMNQAIKDANVTPLDVIQLIANDSLGKVEMIILTGFEIVFASPNSLGPILGFQTDITYSSSVINVGQFVPQLNALNYYLVQCSLVQDGIRFNNEFRQIIETVLIDVAPRELIITRPFHPPTIQIDHLAGQPISSIRTTLLQDNLQPANTDGENYYVRLSLRWLEPIQI